MEYSDITIGCDPEFELVYKGKFIDPSGENNEDFDGVRIGTDCGDYFNNVELRPQHHVSPKGLLNNFRKLSAEVHKKRYKLTVSGLENSIGGHIHIGIRNVDTRHHLIDEVECGTCPLIDALDEFLGKKVMCLSSDIRSGSGYGELGDCRRQVYGIEYRVPSAAIFYRPLLAKYCFMIAKRATYFYLTGHLSDIIENPTAIEYAVELKIKPAQYKQFIREIAITKLALHRAWKANKYLGIRIK